jgi:hypothetical protein
VLDTSKRAHKITKMNTRFFEVPNDYNNIQSEKMNFAFETEKLYTIEISESELERIADFEAEVFNHLRTEGHYNLFEILMRQKEEENRLKENYPAVKKAYEQYSLMLALAKAGDIDARH